MKNEFVCMECGTDVDLDRDATAFIGSTPIEAECPECGSTDIDVKVGGE